MRFSRLCLVLAAMVALPATLVAADPRLEVPAELREFSAEGSTLLAQNGSLSMYSLSSRQIEAAKNWLAMGGGGDVAGLITVQTAFVPGNHTVLMLWNEATLNPSGVEILVNGGSLGVAPGLAAPGTNGVNITGVPAGLFNFAVHSIDDDTTSNADQLVLDAQPFSNALGLHCSPGDIESAEACSIVAEWDNPGPLPDTYSVFLNGNYLGDVPQNSTGVAIGGASPGAYTVTVIGSSADPGGQGSYEGPAVEASCVLTCEPVEVPASGPFAVVLLFIGVGALGAWRLRRRSAAAAA